MLAFVLSDLHMYMTTNRSKETISPFQPFIEKQNLKVTSKSLIIGWLLEFYILATCKVISGQVKTCNSAYSWCRYSAAQLENQATSTLTLYSTQSHYPDTDDIELTSPCPILYMPSTKPGSHKYQFFKSFV